MVKIYWQIQRLYGRIFCADLSAVLPSWRAVDCRPSWRNARPRFQPVRTEDIIHEGKTVSEQHAETPRRIGVDELAEAVTAGVLRAVNQSPDLRERLGPDQAVIFNPIIKYGGPFIITNAQNLGSVINRIDVSGETM
jgi:hypothetical protein